MEAFVGSFLAVNISEMGCRSDDYNRVISNGQQLVHLSFYFLLFVRSLTIASIYPYVKNLPSEPLQPNLTWRWKFPSSDKVDFIPQILLLKCRALSEFPP